MSITYDWTGFQHMNTIECLTRANLKSILGRDEPRLDYLITFLSEMSLFRKSSVPDSDLFSIEDDDEENV